MYVFNRRLGDYSCRPVGKLDTYKKLSSRTWRDVLRQICTWLLRHVLQGLHLSHEESYYQVNFNLFLCDSFQWPIFWSVRHFCQKVESITGELVAAEEEVARWKEAATAEAAAGARVLEEVEIRNKEVMMIYHPLIFLPVSIHSKPVRPVLYSKINSNSRKRHLMITDFSSSTESVQSTNSPFPVIVTKSVDQLLWNGESLDDKWPDRRSWAIP